MSNLSSSTRNKEISKFQTACDGTYLYVWDNLTETVSKVGAGFHGTLAGEIVRSNQRIVPEGYISTPGSCLFFIESKLLINLTEVKSENDKIFVISTNSLELDTQCGKFDIQFGSVADTNTNLNSNELNSNSVIFEFYEDEPIYLRAINPNGTIEIIEASFDGVDILSKLLAIPKVKPDFCIKFPSMRTQMPELISSIEDVPRKLTLKCLFRPHGNDVLRLASDGRHLLTLRLTTSTSNQYLIRSPYQDFTIVSAYYYTSNNSSGDVTSVVKQKFNEFCVNPEKSEFVANNATLSETVFGFAKTLFINFKIFNDDDINTFKFKEDQIVNWTKILDQLHLKYEPFKQVKLFCSIFSYNNNPPEFRFKKVHEVELQSSPNFKVCGDELKFKSSIIYNGQKLVIQQIVLNSIEKSPMESFKCFKFDVRTGQLIQHITHIHAVEDSLPDILCYDYINNMIWSLDETTFTFKRWRNAGLPALPYSNLVRSKKVRLNVNEGSTPYTDSSTIDIDPASLLDEAPINKIDALKEYYDISSTITKSKINQDSSIEFLYPHKLQSALLYALLENLSYPYHPPCHEVSESNSSNLIEISVCSANSSTNGAVGSCSICVKGQLVPAPATTKGFFIVTLDDNFDIFESREFSTLSETSASDRLADYLDSIDIGRVVLVATNGSISTNCTQRIIDCLHNLGGNNIDTINASTSSSLALIGRKGLSKGEGIQSIRKCGGKKSIIRSKIQFINAPLRVDFSSDCLSDLIRNIHTVYQRLNIFDVDDQSTNQDGKCCSKERELNASIIVSCFRILTANLYQMSNSYSETELSQLLPQNIRQLLIDVLLNIITVDFDHSLNDRDRTDLKLNESHVGNILCSHALKLLSFSINILWPNLNQRHDLILNYANKYLNGMLTVNEKKILEMLLKPVANDPSYAFQLVKIIDNESIALSNQNKIIESDVSIESKVSKFKLPNIVIPEDNLTNDQLSLETSSTPTRLPSFSLLTTILSIYQNEFRFKLTALKLNRDLSFTSDDTNFLQITSNSYISLWKILFADKIFKCKTGVDEAKLVYTSLDPKANNSDSVFNFMLNLIDVSQDILNSIEEYLDFVSTIASNEDSRIHQQKQLIEQFLTTSPLQSTLPTSLCSLSLLIQTNEGVLLSLNDNDLNIVVGHLSKLHLSVLKLQERLNIKVNDSSKEISSTDVNNPRLATHIDESLPIPNEQTFVYESSHPYEPNLDVYTEVRIAGALKLIITFDPQSRTEHSCDYIKFFLSDRTTTYHPSTSSFSGRDGSENFPGYNSRDPLVINNDSFVLFFHSDGSVQDWG